MPPQNHKQPRGWSVEWFTLTQFGTIAMFRCIWQYLLPSKDCSGLLLRPVVRSFLKVAISAATDFNLFPSLLGADVEVGAEQTAFLHVSCIQEHRDGMQMQKKSRRDFLLTYLCGIRIKLVGVSYGCGDNWKGIVVMPCHAEIKEPNPIFAVKQLHTGLWNYESQQRNKRWRKGILQNSLDFIHSITTIAPIRTISSWMSLWHVLWHVETDTDVPWEKLIWWNH